MADSGFGSRGALMAPPWPDGDAAFEDVTSKGSDGAGDEGLIPNGWSCRWGAGSLALTVIVDVLAGAGGMTAVPGAEIARTITH